MVVNRPTWRTIFTCRLLFDLSYKLLWAGPSSLPGYLDGGYFFFILHCVVFKIFSPQFGLRQPPAISSQLHRQGEGCIGPVHICESEPRMRWIEWRHGLDVVSFAVTRTHAPIITQRQMLVQRFTLVLSNSIHVRLDHRMLRCTVYRSA